jgi:hypothetical protein
VDGYCSYKLELFSTDISLVMDDYDDYDDYDKKKTFHETLYHASTGAK